MAKTQKIEVFSVNYLDDQKNKVHLGFFFEEDVARQVSKGNGEYEQDAVVTPHTITIFGSVEEFTKETGRKVLTEEEINIRLIKQALEKLTDKEKKALGL